MGKGFEGTITAIDVELRERPQSIEPKILDLKRRHDASADGRAAKVIFIKRSPLSCKIPHEATGKAIARTRGIDDM